MITAGIKTLSFLPLMLLLPLVPDGVCAGGAGREEELAVVAGYATLPVPADHDDEHSSSCRQNGSSIDLGAAEEAASGAVVG